jgi:uncharacterized ParB-like nuclease family protein
LYQYRGEILTALDNSRYTLTKAIADALSIDDTVSLVHGKTPSEALTATDSAARTSSLAKAEVLTATDSNAFSFAFGVTSDGVTAADLPVLNTQLAKADSVTMSDSAVVVLIFLRDVFDTVAATDVPAILFSTAYTEVLAPTDTSSYSFSQSLTDAFGMNDLADIGDGIAFDFVDFTANVVTIADSQVLQVSPAYSDTISTSDTGVGSIQDYSDITYFAEDYVGSRFTF